MSDLNGLMAILIQKSSSDLSELSKTILNKKDIARTNMTQVFTVFKMEAYEILILEQGVVSKS